MTEEDGNEPKTTKEVESTLPVSPKEQWRRDVITFFNSKVRNAGTCKECQQASTIRMATDVVTPVLLENNTSLLGVRNYPQVMLVCSNCGNTRYFNLNAIKMLPPEG